MQKIEELFNAIFQDICSLVSLVTESLNELVLAVSDATTQYEKIKSRLLSRVSDIRAFFGTQQNPEIKRAGETVRGPLKYAKVL
jgi:ElaB/YqjD/DUF883 family membrane-anchored ribosome-binding protein